MPLRSPEKQESPHGLQQCAEKLQGRASEVKTPEANARLMSRLKPRPTISGHFSAAS